MIVVLELHNLLDDFFLILIDGFVSDQLMNVLPFVKYNIHLSHLFDMIDDWLMYASKIWGD